MSGVSGSGGGTTGGTGPTGPDVPGTITVARRFRGPDASGNGGWTAGALAAALLGADAAGGRPVEVTLRRPPALDTPLVVEAASAGPSPVAPGTADRTARLLDPRGALVAEARTLPPEDLAALVPPRWPGPSSEEAAAAAAGFPGHLDHPFPGCFACGPDRADGDGLRVFPGPLAPADGSDLPDGAGRWVAAPWVPGDDVDVPTTWAALDCSGGWAGDLGTGRQMVLGRITAALAELPGAGERCVVVGALLGTEGRRTRTASRLSGADGRLLGTAAHTWVAVDPARFR